MNSIRALFRREIREYFCSPVAYVILAVFVTLTGFFFYLLTSEFLAYSLRTESHHIRGVMQTPNLNEMVIRPLFSTTGFLCMLLLPMVSMRLIAAERRSGTIQLLLTSPIRSWELALGKYAASLGFYLVMVMMTGAYLLPLFYYSSPDIQPVLVGMLGLALMGAAFLALGLFVSSLTQSQIVAGTLTFGLLFLFWIVSWAGENTSGSVRVFLEYISLYQHHQDMAKGILNSSDIVYYASLIFLGLFLTTKRLEALRW